MASTAEVKAQLDVSIERVTEAQAGEHNIKGAFGEINVASSLADLNTLGGTALALAAKAKELPFDTVAKNTKTTEDAYRAGLKGTENQDVKDLFASLEIAKDNLTGDESAASHLGAYAVVLEEVGNTIMAANERLKEEAVPAVGGADESATAAIADGAQVIELTQAYQALL